uniref:RRM domain-containing protein n=1 Tax=Panagrolaimus superbus TaxID=310955 RepID=A0A914YS94_9BILA
MNPQEGYNNAQDNHGHMNGGIQNGDGQMSRGKNEDRKIFVGGIGYDVQDEELRQYFSKFGEVVSANVKFDRTSGRSRGFAFVEFAKVEDCQRALQVRDQQIKNKTVEIKAAKSHEKKKVFIGGIPSDLTEEELRGHFETYGKVEEIEWPTDKNTKLHRNFAFIIFEDESAADAASQLQKHTIRDRECDVKKAVPRSRRVFPGQNGLMNMHPFGQQMGGLGGPHQQQQWFNPQQWSAGLPMGGSMPYGGAGGAHGWNDWYQNAANMASYYTNASANGGQNTSHQPTGGPNAHNGGGYGGQHGGGQNNYKQNRSRLFSGYDNTTANIPNTHQH